MPDIKRTVKLVTRQRVKDEDPPADGGLPTRAWSISVFLVGPDGENLPASCFEKVAYHLHESFGKRAKQAFKVPPFTIEEEGWGEFDMTIHLTPLGNPKGGDHTITHDLNFQREVYESTHSITFRNPKEPLLSALKESAPAGEAPAINGNAKLDRKRYKPANRTVDIDKLADALPQLQEDDLLQIVQLIHDNRTDESYIKNDFENGEFHVDLYTLSDSLIKAMWDLCDKKIDLAAL